jgi:type III secretion system needle length determinant
LLKDDLPGEKAVLYDSGDGEAPPSEMLSSLLSRSLGSLSQAGPGSVEAAQQAETPAASDLAEKLVSRILVSSPDSAGQEARLMVDPALLADTEIRLTRGPDGFLSVNLITSDQNALQALVEARGSLESALSRTEGPAFRVTVEDSRADAQGGGEQQGRSKGLDFADEPQ